MAHESLEVQTRESSGKGPARRMRAAGKVPAVLYGHGNEPTALAVVAHDLDELLRKSAAGINTLIDLKGDVSGKTVLIKELQREPVRGSLVHADFYAIDVNEAIVVEVPLEFVGEAKGVDEGGLLEELVRVVEVSCLPDSIPDSIEVDVSHLEIGDSIHVHEIAMPPGSTLESDPELLAVSCVESRALVAETEAEEGEAAEGEEGAGAEGEEGEGSSDSDSDSD